MNNKLLALVNERPTLTLTRNSSEKTKIEFDKLPKSRIGRNFPIPDNFDGRKVWKGLLTKVRNQGKCGSCWAFSSTSTLADRFNIQSLGQINIELSPTKLILCDFMGEEIKVKHPEIESDLISKLNSKNLNIGACHGNTLYDAWRYLYLIGTNTEECIPYDASLKDELTVNSVSNFSKDDKLPFCSVYSGDIGDMCINNSMNMFTGDEYGDPARFYRCIHFYSIAGTEKDGGNESYIRHNIYAWGPITTGMIVYPDFYVFNAKKEIYKWNGKGDPVGGHAIEIVGWGEENGQKYWIIKNSWGEEWGRNGFFYMSRGDNNCEIEDNTVTGIPDFFYPQNYILNNPNNFVWIETGIIAQEREDIDNLLTTTGGGIEPSLGYTRRIMIDKPWIDYKRPILLENLPDWNTFIAAINASPKKRYEFLRKIKKENLKTYTDLPMILSFISIIILIVYLFILKMK